MDRIESDTWQPAQTECRAVVVTSAAAVEPAFTLTHPSAAFVTQLLAIKAGLPQMRERRREEPEVAAHVYEARMTAPPQHAGTTLRRAL
jgi:hypothetical protein